MIAQPAGCQSNQLLAMGRRLVAAFAIAALFTPLLRRVQDFIDRRFYRRKYDAAKTLAEFAATARDEVELEKLVGRLVEVVEDTMQPERVGLWLKPTADHGRQTAVGGRPSALVSTRRNEP